LEETGRLSGVIDERGKYIYLTEQEMKVFDILDLRKWQNLSIVEVVFVNRI